MLPTVISREIEEGIKSCLRTSCPSSTLALGRAAALPRAVWNEVRALQSGTVKRTVTDTTLPTGPIEREIIWHTPFTTCNRESDYATVWRKLEEKGAAK